MSRSGLRLKRIQQALGAWFRSHGRELPWRRTRDPYHILVSEIMLQQTQVDRVLPKYRAFLERFPTVYDLATAAPGDVIRAWAGLGYNRRALNLQRTAKTVAAEYQGRFPQTPEELSRLPGIGPYTAGAVACFAFERDVAFMDTNIRRVIGRVFVGPDGNPPWGERELLEQAKAAVPAGDGYQWNQAVMELGALVCTAARPRCTICPIRADCRAYAAWCKADENIFQPELNAPRTMRTVAERQAPYATSNRFFRGRIVALLRDLPPGTAAPLCELGPQLKDDWNDDELPWLENIVQTLAAEGLLVLEHVTGGSPAVRLP
jgi:A/G-specific adenine glycosylase